MIWPVWCGILVRACLCVRGCVPGASPHTAVSSAEGQKVSVSATRLKQDGTLTSPMEWEECKYVPNDLEEKQNGSVSESVSE